jgi:hypothetical protein
MSIRTILRIALLAAAAVALIAAAAEPREKQLAVDETVNDIEDQTAALDPATRAAAVGQLTADATAEVKHRINP